MTPKNKQKIIIPIATAAFIAAGVAVYFLAKDAARPELPDEPAPENVPGNAEAGSESPAAEGKLSVEPLSDEEVELENPCIGDEGGHQWLDMGTRVRWAACNIGAASPRDHGDFYAWGEISAKETYDTDNSLTYGKRIGGIAGNAACDAARALWGGDWRLPTREECQELIDSCSWRWDGSGYEVTARNGNVLYLPAAGWHNMTSVQDAGDLGRYWTATPAGDEEAYALWINLHRRWLETFDRDTGYSIRPVLP
ncbi:MAG: hypothetical protein K2N16_02470 [Muribaculaceae bacterium]|nr:hypothetical protein [Muribaculaceae bacterium]